MAKVYDTPQHKIMKDGFMIKITVNDEFYVKNGGAKKEHTDSGEGYVLCLTSGNGMKFQTQGNVSLIGVLRGLLDITSPEEIEKALKEAIRQEVLSMLFKGRASLSEGEGGRLN